MAYDTPAIIVPHHQTSIGRQRRTGTGAAMLRAKEGFGLTVDQLRQFVPAVVAEQAHVSRSDKFVPIPTFRVIEEMQKNGFKVVSARQGGSRVEGKAQFTKHQVRLRHVSQSSTNLLGALHAEIVLTNGNDGTAAYGVEMGLFRLICTNGMYAYDDVFKAPKVRHNGREDQIIQDVLDASFHVMGLAPQALEMSGEMDRITVSDRAAFAFADAAKELRWGGVDAEGKPVQAPVPVEALLTARRQEDSRKSLWNTFNVVQENLIKGAEGYNAGHMRYTLPANEARKEQHRSVRPVNGVDQDGAINRALWVLGQHFKREVLAA